MKLLITAGPTREPMDQVRYIGNRSSGKMGLAIAAAADRAGHDATLLVTEGIDTPSLPEGVTIARFESAADLQQLLERHWPSHDALVMAAAVADYRPAERFEGKQRRRENSKLVVELEAVPDLVAQMAANKRADQRVVAFALEPASDLEPAGLAKQRNKGVDAIVANSLATMGSDRVDPCWIVDESHVERPGAMDKSRFADWLIDKLISDLGLR